jgi:hypothetical protein
MGLLGSVVALGIIAWNMNLANQLFGRAGGKPAEIHVNTAQILGPLPRPWRNIAQGGEGKDYDFLPVVDKIKALHTDMIRIDHVFDFYDVVYRNSNNQMVYDFSKLDKVIKGITASGAKPFIVLSYLPSIMQTETMTDKPSDWQEWKKLIQKTVEHISGTNGLGIEGVYYEVWNEPDLFGGWKINGAKSYLDLYRHTVMGAMQAQKVKAYKIGGPATTAFYPNWINGLLQYSIENNLKLDFISWHRYDKKLDKFESDMNQAEAILEDYPQISGVEKIISEWGFDSRNNQGYDNLTGAAQLIAVANLMPAKIDKGFVFELQDSKDPDGKDLWGRWGLLAAQAFGSKPKARYEAMNWLEKLGNDRLVISGRGSWVNATAAARPGKTENDKVTQVLLANWDDNGRHVENVPIFFHQIEPGDFKVTKQILGGPTSGSLESTDSADLKILVTMPVNSVMLVELEKIK